MIFSINDCPFANNLSTKCFRIPTHSAQQAFKLSLAYYNATTFFPHHLGSVPLERPPAHIFNHLSKLWPCFSRLPFPIFFNCPLTSFSLLFSIGNIAFILIRSMFLTKTRYSCMKGSALCNITNRNLSYCGIHSFGPLWFSIALSRSGLRVKRCTYGLCSVTCNYEDRKFILAKPVTGFLLRDSFWRNIAVPVSV